MLALWLAAGVQAAAPAAAVEADLRCLAVATLAGGGAADERTRQGASVAAMYYVGRIDAVRPGVDYEKELVAIFEGQRNGRALTADAARCGAELQARGATLQAVGSRLQRRGAAKR